MKKKQLNNPEEKKTIIKNLNPQDDNSSKSKNPRTESEKTQVLNHVPDLLLERAIEDAKIEDLSPAEKMEQIIQNNDKFETIRVIMNILIKELGLPETASIEQIVRELNKVSERYYASMEEWKKMTKTPIK